MAKVTAYGLILDRIVALIQAEADNSLPETQTANIVLQKKITNTPADGLILPWIIVAPTGTSAPIQGSGTCQSDDIPFGVVIAHARIGNEDQTDEMDNVFATQYVIRTLFHDKKLTGVTGFTTIHGREVRATTFEAPSWFLGYDTEFQIYTFTARIVRASVPDAWS